MTPTWWRRRRLHRPAEENGKSHAQRISEATHAIREGEQTLVEVGRLGDEVGVMADKLGSIRSRNHFSELVAEMLRAQGGGSTPASRRG
jgi:hypothetical protein